MKRTICAVLSLSVLTFSALTFCVDVTAISSSIGKVSTRSSDLNVRSSASTDSEILASLERGSIVTLVSEDSDWWRVQYGENLYGYCSAEFITELDASRICYVNTDSDALNVRSGAGLSYSVEDCLPKGKSVTVISENDSGWSSIVYDGCEEGYVKSKYLSQQDTSPYPEIALSVSAFKQTDTRWGSINLGSSYETISSAGCTTTCLAMSESYRTDGSIYPDKMESSLSYSSSGSLYWPSGYVTSTDSDNWLETVYSILVSGKPVIVGSRKSSGSQHWVLVTGYNGSALELSASGFVINDPATVSRSTLLELLSDYPIFMKLAYYS